MAYLNEEYTGGATVFRSSRGGTEEVRGQRGGVLVFNHDVEHEGREVKGGRKYILRTDSA